MKKLIVFTHLLLALLGSATGQSVTTLKVAMYDPPNSPFVAMLREWGDNVMRDAAGTVKVEVYPAGTLGSNPTQQIKLMLDGVADVVWALPAYTPGRFPDVEVAELPFTFDNTLQGSLGIWRLFSKGNVGGFDEVRPLMLGTTNQLGVHTVNPMDSVAALKGKKIRVSTPLGSAFIEKIGAAPVQIAPTKVAESVSRGIVDGFVGEWNFVNVFQLDRVTNFHIDVPLGAGVQMIAMTRKRYESLPPQARAAIDKHSGEVLVRKYAKISMDGAEAARSAAVAKSASSVVKPTGQAYAEWAKSAQPIIDGWVAANPGNRKLLDLFKAELLSAKSE